MLKISNEKSDGYICDYVLQSATLLENGICIYYFVGNILEFFRLAILLKDLPTVDLIKYYFYADIYIKAAKHFKWEKIYEKQSSVNTLDKIFLDNLLVIFLTISYNL